MRIGLFTDTYTPDINGVVTSIVTLKEALEREGHKVFVITNHASITSTSYENGVLRLPGVEVKFMYGYVLSSPIHIQAASVIKEMELDVIHAHSEFGIGIFARAICKLQEIPLVMTYHTTYEDYTHYVNLLGLKSVDMLSRKLVASVSRMYSKGSEIIIAPSEKTKKMLLGYKIKKRIDVIPTGLDLERFKDKDEAAILALKEKYGLDGSSLFVYIGRLAKEKSIDIVIEGFAKLIQSGEKAQLLIVGGGPSDEDLKQMAHDLGVEDRIIFVGPVASKEVVNFYHVSDAFISASLTETQGLTYIEALACGLCVFARPDKPLEGIIIDDNTGYLFEDLDSFVTKAKGFIHASEEKREELKNNALRLAQNFDSKFFAQNVLRTYQDAIDAYHGMYLIEDIEVLEDDLVFISLLSKQSKKGAHQYLWIDEYLLTKYNLKVGDELSRVEIDKYEDEQGVFSAYQKAILRIGRRDYTSFEMKNYLRDEFSLTEDLLDTIIMRLVDRGFINDEKFFNDRLSYCRSLDYGNYRIEEDLLKRGFDLDKIQEALADEDDLSLYERAIRRADKYLATQRENSSRQREYKLKRHLAQQGFEEDLIEAVCKVKIDEYTEESEYQSLKNAIVKAQEKYSKKYDVYDTRNRVIKTCLSKGYPYEMIVECLKELEDEN